MIKNNTWIKDLDGIAKPLQANDKYASRIYENDHNKQYSFRSNYQHDRDRILYTPSFRLLIGKTQVFHAGKAAPSISYHFFILSGQMAAFPRRSKLLMQQ